MNTFKTILFSLTILLSFNTIVLAQVQESDLSNAGSFYSSFGFGTPSDVNNPFSMGMGLSGVSNYSGFSPSISNPAHWGMAGYTQGNVSMALQNFEASDDFGNASSSIIGIESFQFVFPLKRSEIGASISFSPAARADFQRVEVDEFTSIPGLSPETVQYAILTNGSGGVNRIEVGMGYQPADFLSIGYGFSVNILSLNEEVIPGFSDTQFTTSSFSREVDGYGFGHRFGIHTYFSNIFNNSDQFAMGASIGVPVTIDSERSIRSFRTVGNRRTLVELNEGSSDRNGTIKLPLEFNAGITYNLNRRVNFVAEFLHQNWGDAEFSYDPNHETFYKDRTKTGFGFQYHPYRTEQRGGFFSKFKYSLGTSYDNGHLTINGQDIETIFLNGGIGIISQRSASSIDLSFQYGIRGTQSSNLVKEDIWGVKLSLNLAELMFIRSRFQ